MMRLSAAVLGLGLITGGARAGDAVPYLGEWNCEVATFRFTPDAYDNGSETMPVKKVEKKGGNYVLHFDGGYEIGLSDIRRDTMQWLSFESGDEFTCRRIR